MKAKDLQIAVYRWCWAKGMRCMAPNIHLLLGESDFIAVTRAGYAYEFECKISRADFFADMRKVRASYDYTGEGMPKRIERTKHEILASTEPARTGHRDGRTYRRPKRFYFVTPAGLVAPEEVPAHCGLLEVAAGKYGGFYATPKKAAPDIRGEKLTADDLEQIASSLSHRFFLLWLNSEVVG